MVVIGITGPIGAGKSLLAELLRARGAEVVEADRLGHRLLEPDTPTYGSVVEAFGTGILDETGRVDRTRLGALVFESRENLDRLNRIVHPELLRRLEMRIEEFRSRPAARGGVLAIDAALLFQWKMERQCDWVLWVDAPAAIRRRRFVDTGRIDAQDFNRRDALQRAHFKKVTPGGRILKINNSGTELELTNQINRFWKEVVDHEK